MIRQRRVADDLAACIYAGCQTVFEQTSYIAGLSKDTSVSLALHPPYETNGEAVIEAPVVNVGRLEPSCCICCRCRLPS